eukprot:CAMPEP_0174709266 /NCGR_PEP_ID=MMETSP1094-20130205/11286_1 /TAXON_ID=156173 /ORGANISM="Chrysochromulina brevifilum, Strain UTEX LB 985" /LENGTH=132 /DNA_ID=CAMNT_0015907927 /DNA_START=79 /DNA_END=473 /DNA_ORIENTATION=+
MGDWGMAYMPSTSARSNASEMARCVECGFTQFSLGLASCSMCGGTAFRAAASAATQDVSRPTRPPDEDVERHAEAILSAILPADLLGGSMEGPSKPADDEIVSSLPLVKIEPHVVLRVSRKSAALPSRQLLA